MRQKGERFGGVEPVMGFQEIADKLGMKRQNVCRLYYRAMDKLRHNYYANRLKGEGW